MWKGVIFLAVLALGGGVAASGREVVDARYGYKVTLPTNWKQLPPNIVQEMAAKLFRRGAPTPKYIAAFEPAAHTHYFAYPYVVVQVKSYRSGVTLGTVSHSDIENLATKITGIKPDHFKQYYSQDVGKIAGPIHMGSPTVLTAPPGFVMDINQNVAGSAVRGRTCCLFGCHNLVFFQFYALKSDWPAESNVLKPLLSSFRRTPTETVVFGSATLTPSGRPVDNGFHWNKAWTTGVVGAFLGGLIALALKHKRQPKS